MGMDRVRVEKARRMLVEGYAAVVGGIARRQYPSQARVAREIGVPTSTVTRWSARAGISSLRADRLAQDRREGREVPVTPEEVPVAVLRMTTAMLEAGHAISKREMNRVLRLCEWLAGFEPLWEDDLLGYRARLARMLAAGPAAMK